MRFLFCGISPLRFSFEKRIYIENYTKMPLQASIFTYIIKILSEQRSSYSKEGFLPFLHTRLSFAFLFL